MLMQLSIEQKGNKKHWHVLRPLILMTALLLQQLFHKFLFSNCIIIPAIFIDGDNAT